MLAADPLPALVDFLKEGLGQDARVYGGRLDRFFNKRMPAPCVVLSASGIGSGEGHEEESPYASQRMDCLAYDNTEARSAALSVRAHKQLLRICREMRVSVSDDLTTIVSVVLTGGPTPVVDNNTDWYGILRVYNVLAEEV